MNILLGSLSFSILGRLCFLASQIVFHFTRLKNSLSVGFQFFAFHSSAGMSSGPIAYPDFIHLIVSSTDAFGLVLIIDQPSRATRGSSCAKRYMDNIVLTSQELRQMVVIPRLLMRTIQTFLLHPSHRRLDLAITSLLVTVQSLHFLR